MTRSGKVKIAVILGGALAITVIGTFADRMMRADGGDSIAGNIYMMVLVGTVALVTAVIKTDRNREVGVADAETRSQALDFSAMPGHARVVIFRNDKMGARLGADVKLDERLHTQLTSPGFTVLDLAPGNHLIVLEWEGQRAEHAMDAREGDVVALHMKMRMGLSTTSASLEPVSAESARKMIGSAPMALPIATAG